MVKLLVLCRICLIIIKITIKETNFSLLERHHLPAYVPFSLQKTILLPNLEWSFGLEIHFRAIDRIKIAFRQYYEPFWTVCLRQSSILSLNWLCILRNKLFNFLSLVLQFPMWKSSKVRECTNIYSFMTFQV